MSDKEFTEAVDYVHQVLGVLRQAGSTYTVPLQVLEDFTSAGPLEELAEPEQAAGTGKGPAPTESKAIRSQKDSFENPRARTPVARASLPVLPPLAHGHFKAGDDVDRETSLAKWRDRILKDAGENDLEKLGQTQLIFGAGSATAKVLFISEAPGEDEDITTDPLATEAGTVLLKMLETMGLTLRDVYIAHLPRFREEKRRRSSDRRHPTEAECNRGAERISELIELLQPKVIVAMGAVVAGALLGQNPAFGKIRSQWQEFRKIPVLPTYHPSFLIHNQAASKKREVWSDMLLVMEKLGLEISQKQRGYFLPK